MSNEVYDTLVAAKKLIRREKNWTKHTHFIDTIEGRSYCALGAVAAALNPTMPEPYPYLLGERAQRRWVRTRDALAEFVPPHESVGTWNDLDDTTHRDVIRLFNRAIKAEKKKGLL